jgi:uncharacterized protein YegL
MKTKIICILDRSGSMQSIIKDAIGGFNSFLTEQQTLDDIAYMDIILFDDEYYKLVNNVNIKEVKELNRSTYSPRGSTALYDAIGRTINEQIDHYAENPNNRSDKTLCVILTDGEENASVNFNQFKIKLMIEEMEKDFNWNFIFLAANQDAMLSAEGMGISMGNAMNFAADGDGVSIAYSNINNAATYYRSTSNVDYSNMFEDSKTK